MRYILTILLLLASLSLHAGQIDDAKAAYDRRDFATAFKLFQPLAEQGDIKAQTYLGWMYYKGLGVGAHYQNAITWSQKAAEQGDPEAQINLGDIYTLGRHVAEDDIKAATSYQKAADQGNARAQLNLAGMYEIGRGVPEDLNLAITWYRKAAEQGNVEAQIHLGDLFDKNDIYRRGKTAVDDEDDAIYWYKQAAAQGNTGAQTKLANAQNKLSGIQAKIAAQRDAPKMETKPRKDARFGSFQEALQALGSMEVHQEGFQLIEYPMSLKGKIVVVRMMVLQMLDNGNMLLTFPYMGSPELDNKIYFGYIPANYTGSREFFDNEPVDIVGEITGTHQYTTAQSTLKTVPQMKIYGIRATGSQ